MNELQNFDYLKFKYEKDLHEVFATVLDCFPNITGATVRGQIYLWELLQKIKYNLGFDIDAYTFLLPKYVNGIRNTAYDERKVQLPAICYNANFKDYKNLDNLKLITNLMFLDIDYFKTKEEALAYRELIIHKYDWILACNLSLSKLGLHVIIMVDKINNTKDYNYKYDYISKEFFNGKLDKNSKSLIRYTVVPYDHNIYINESPKMLDIENIVRNNEDSISSGYKEERIICTPYTIFPLTPVKEILNVAARQNGLKFKQDVDDSLFQDPNIPIYVHEGIDVIKINLYPYRYTGVKEGHRTVFMGAISAQMIYLNIESPDQINDKIKEEILKFILSINKKICDPPLTYKEVMNSFNANWKKYEAGELDFSKYFQKQKAFWSKNSTLRGNEKRKVTCKIKNEPVVRESKRKIKEAIETLKAQGIKVTQNKVANLAGLKLPTVKKYRDYYNELINKKKMDIKNNDASDYNKEPEKRKEVIVYREDADLALPIRDSFDSETSLESECKTKIENPEIIDYDEDTFAMSDILKFCITDKQKQEVFVRIFNGIIKRLDEQQVQELYTRFEERLNNLPHEEVRLLTLKIDDINDSDTFFKQGTLDSKIFDLCNELFHEASIIKSVKQKYL